MRNRHFILFSLLAAYMVMFAHSVIPHHHHDTQQEAERHHQEEHSTHHHGSETSEGHGHTAHFVHSPDFDNYVAASSMKQGKLPTFSVDLLFTCPAFVSFSIEQIATTVCPFLDIPPPNLIYLPLPNGMRGSPSIISVA